MTGKARSQSKRPVPPATSPTVGTLAAYAAGIVAFAYALVSLYWALGWRPRGRGLFWTSGSP